MTTENGCSVCGATAKVEHFNHPMPKSGPGHYFSLRAIECDLCGCFYLDDDGPRVLRHKEAEQRFRASTVLTERSIRGINKPVLVWVHEMEPPKIDIPAVLWKDLVSSYPASMTERIDRTLMNLERLSPEFGTRIKVGDQTNRATYSKNEAARRLLLEVFVQDGLILKLGENELLITPKGWIRIDDLHREHARHASKRVFIALAFSPPNKSKAISNAIEEAVRATGYEPAVLLGRESNDKICELIIAEIKRSRFVIADFTGQRQNVYFEAGFALGLGLPVIWTCEKADIEGGGLHFDTRQYSHIDWNTYEDLTERLTNRINATI